MKAIIVSLAAALTFAGCANQSPTEQFVGDAAVTGGAAAVGYKVSNGNPVATVGAGIAGLGLKRLADTQAQKKRDKELKEAEDRGYAQAMKSNYWKHQDAQSQNTTEPNNGPAKTKLPIAAPERVVNGVIVNPTTEYIAVDDTAEPEAQPTTPAK